jgi:hypothetical protein
VELVSGRGNGMATEPVKVYTEEGVPMKYLPEPYKAIKPIFVRVEQWRDPETYESQRIWVHPSTESWAETFAELKRQLIALYEDLMETPDEELGKLPTAWKAWMIEHIAKA